MKKSLKVRTSVKAGGLCGPCSNHNRRLAQ